MSEDSSNNYPKVSIEFQDIKLDQHILDGRILTAVGEEIDIAPDLREILVACSDGKFIVSSSHIYNQRVRSLKARIERAGYTFLETIQVSMSEIRDIYEQYEELAASSSIGAARIEDQSQLQQDFKELLAKAVSKGAGDLHISGDRASGKIRIRKNGRVRDMEQLQPEYAMQLMRVAYTLADNSDKQYLEREPQGGSITRAEQDLPAGVGSVRLQWSGLFNSGRLLAVRIHPTKHRITGDVDLLGYTEKQVLQIKQLRRLPSGIVLVCGPTGSGKTTTIQYCLTSLIRERKREINVLSVEDPVEAPIEGVYQMPVMNVENQEDRNEAYLKVLRSALRSDPDVLYISEIRDPQAAKLGMEGCLTGHQIWATLHANDNIRVFDRLQYLLDDFQFQTALDPEILTGLISQRLVAKLCDHCKEPIENHYNSDHIDELASERFEKIIRKFSRGRQVYVRGSGCDHCDNGYSGMAVASEVLLPDETFMMTFREQGKFAARDYWLKEMGGETMVTHAMASMFDGKLSPVDIEERCGLLRYEAYMDIVFGTDEEAAVNE